MTPSMQEGPPDAALSISLLDGQSCHAPSFQVPSHQIQPSLGSLTHICSSPSGSYSLCARISARTPAAPSIPAIGVDPIDPAMTQRALLLTPSSDCSCAQAAVDHATELHSRGGPMTPPHTFPRFCPSASHAEPTSFPSKSSRPLALPTAPST